MHKGAAKAYEEQQSAALSSTSTSKNTFLKDTREEDE